MHIRDLVHFPGDCFSQYYYCIRHSWTSHPHFTYSIIQGCAMNSRSREQVLADMPRQAIKVSSNIRECFPELAHEDVTIYM